MDNAPIFSESDNSCDVVFDETLSLVATLYKNKAKGTFQEKNACLVVRLKKKTTRRGLMYQGWSNEFIVFVMIIIILSLFAALGVVEMDLSTIAEDIISGSAVSTEYRFPLTKSFINGAYLDVTITPKLMSTEGSPDGQDDTMSMQSGFSDAPVMSADFDNNMASIPKYPSHIMTPEKVIEEDEDEDTNVEIVLSLHKKTLELEFLKGDHDQLVADHAHCREELDNARIALEQLRAQVHRQMEDTKRESDITSLTLSRISAAASFTTDQEAVASLNSEIKALYAELDAQKKVHSTFVQSVEVKEVRWAESETRNLHLLEKVNQLAQRNIALKASLADTFPKKEYEERRKSSEDELKRQITDLKSTKDNAESELERQIEVNNDLKRRLQLYSENIAELEVSGVAHTTGNSTKKTLEKKCRRDSVEGGEVVETVTFEGALTKRGSFYPSWKNRHFILHGDAHLSYYTNKDDMVFKGHFVITKDTVLGQAKVSGYDCFYLEHTKRRLYMTAATPLEEIEWMAVFRRSIAALKL